MDSASFGDCLGIKFPSLTPDPPNGHLASGSRSPYFSMPSVLCTSKPKKLCIRGKEVWGKGRLIRAGGRAQPLSRWTVVTNLPDLLGSEGFPRTWAVSVKTGGSPGRAL